MLPPFIEINGQVHAVVGWEPDMPLAKRIELRRLPEAETARYRRLKVEAQIELWMNWKGGE
jgi:hypothetical protein